MEDIENNSVINSSHLQILFFSTEKILKNLTESVYNIPLTSGSEELNKLINLVAEGFEGYLKSFKFKKDFFFHFKMIGIL